MNERAGRVIMIVAAGFVLGLAVYFVTRSDDPSTTSIAGVATSPSSTAAAATGSDPTQPATTLPPTTTTTAPPQDREPGTVPGFTVGRPWGTTVGMTDVPGQPDQNLLRVGPGAR